MNRVRQGDHRRLTPALRRIAGFFGVQLAVIAMMTCGARAGSLPDAYSYEYFGIGSLQTSSSVGTLNYTGDPGCTTNETCEATTSLTSPSVYLTLNQMEYNGGGAGYAEANLIYYVELNAPTGNYNVTLSGLSDTLAYPGVQQGLSSSAYFAFGPTVPVGDLDAPNNVFDSFTEELRDCTVAGGGDCAGPSNVTTAPFPSSVTVSMAANTLYAVELEVVIDPETNEMQDLAEIDGPTFSTDASGATFSFSPGVSFGANNMPEPASGAIMLGGLAGLAVLRWRRGRRPAGKAAG